MSKIVTIKNHRLVQTGVVKRGDWVKNGTLPWERAAGLIGHRINKGVVTCWPNWRVCRRVKETPSTVAPISYALPWHLKQDTRRHMSAVTDNNGHVVCGSLICQQSNPDIFDAHRKIVEAVNEKYR